MHRPDGMGADRHRERDNMRRAASDEPEYNFDVVMIDTETGEQVGITESTYTREQAEEARKQCANAFGTPDEVRYKVVERD